MDYARKESGQTFMVAATLPRPANRYLGDGSD